MIEKNYNEDYEKGLSTLEDIQLLSEFSMSPLISRAYFHLSEMKRKADQNLLGKLESCHLISDILDQKMDDIFQEHFSNTKRYKGHTYHKSTKNIDIAKWNTLFEIIPEVLSVVSLFKYLGNVDVNLDENRLLISGVLLENLSIEANRKLIYVITRKFLRKKVLLTFQTENLERPGMIKLILKVDMSYDDSLVYNVNFKINGNEQLAVGFSNIFYRYRVLPDEVGQMGEHHIVEISNGLQVHSNFGKLNLNRLDSANKEILHFPFIFHPISIILPIKGRLAMKSSALVLNDEENRKQDVSKKFHFIDFFSLFNL